MCEWDVLVCDVNALVADKPLGHRKKDNETIIKTANKIMREALPCDDCVKADGCLVQCSLFSRYVNSQGKPWKTIEVWKNDHVKIEPLPRG